MKDFVIIPTFNEADNIKPLILEVFKVLPEINILVVDDNSPDGTGSIVEEMSKENSKIHLLKREKKDGLGGAYIEAFKKVLGVSNLGLVFMMDADFSHSPKYLLDMKSKAKDYDVVVGSRYIPGGGVPKWEPWRRFLSWGGNIYSRLILGRMVHDWTAGFYCINSGILKKVNLNDIKPKGYAFQLHLKYLLLSAGGKVKEIPIIFDERRGGKSKITNSIIKEGVLAPWKIIYKK